MDGPPPGGRDTVTEKRGAVGPVTPAVEVAAGERTVGAAGTLGTVGAVRSGAAEAASGAPGSPPVGAAAAAVVVGAAPVVAGSRVVRAVPPDGLRHTKFK